MARNRVQFQKGYSLVQFMDEYGTEEKCTEALFRWRWPNGFVCPRCEHTGHCEPGFERRWVASNMSRRSEEQPRHVMRSAVRRRRRWSGP